MIYVDLKGNLGNQLFIYAFARNIQLKTNQKILISTYNLNKYFPNYKCSLQEFRLNDNCEFGSNKMPNCINENLLLFKILKRIIPMKLKKVLLKKYYYHLSKRGMLFWIENEYIDVDYENLKKCKDIYINGFWQSPRYFEDIKDLIKSELTPKEELNLQNKNLFDIINSTESICVSIRRGDYLSNPKITKKYFLCDNDYFEKAIKKITQYKKNICIICFSDDIEWVKQNVKYNYPMYFESGKDTLGQKIQLMSACKNFIISNSSFSWWVQYLSNKEDAIVIAPSRWYSDGSGKDIYERKWILIPVGEDITNE